MPVWPRKYWHEMTPKEFADIEPRTIAVLPVAAIEQHGPHLPVWVDTCINEGIVRHMLDRLPGGLPVTVLPTLAIGKSVEHVSFPGTLTLSAETLARVWIEVGESVARAGIRKLVILNSHGGQPQVMEIVARELRIRRKMFVVTLNWWGVGMPDGLFPPDEARHGIHAGSSETSLMMYLAPELVRDHERRDFRPATRDLAERYRYLNAEGAGVGFGWQAEDLHPSGACGNAADADAGRGRLIVETVADRLIELMREVDDFTIPY